MERFTVLMRNCESEFWKKEMLFDDELRSSAGARYTKSIASLELRHKENNNDPYSLHNNTIDFTQ